MRFLIDTNVLISSEPTQPDEIEPVTRASLDLARLASGGHQLLVHPLVSAEIDHDKNAARRQVRRRRRTATQRCRRLRRSSVR